MRVYQFTALPLVSDNWAKIGLNQKYKAKTAVGLFKYAARGCGTLHRVERSHPPAGEQETDYRCDCRSCGLAACIERLYGIAPLECPKRKAQIRIIAFIHDEHSIKAIMKARSIPDFQAPAPDPTFIDAAEAIDEPPWHDSRIKDIRPNADLQGFANDSLWRFLVAK